MADHAAGDLKRRVAFDKRTSATDGYGNTVGGWAEQFLVAAGYLHLKGGETVMAARLEGQHMQVIFVRLSSQTLGVSTEWRIRDARASTIYNIRDITPTEDRQWLEFLVQSGVASG